MVQHWSAVARGWSGGRRGPLIVDKTPTRLARVMAARPACLVAEAIPGDPDDVPGDYLLLADNGRRLARMWFGDGQWVAEFERGSSPCGLGVRGMDDWAAALALLGTEQRIWDELCASVVRLAEECARAARVSSND